MSGKLEGKIAVVTGSARGIGAGIAGVLAQEGAHIAVLDLLGAQAEETASGLGVPAIGIGTDCAVEEDVNSAIEQVVKHFGGVDILINNAGGARKIAAPDVPLESVLPMTGISSHDQETWDEQLETNLRTTFLMSKVTIPHLKARGQGVIINIASIAGLTPNTTITAYAAAKAGVISLSRSLALELAPFDIRCNAICPGFLWTRAWETLATGMKVRIPQYAETSPRDVFLDVVKQRVPLGREQTPQDIGNLAAFLSSDEARNITGQVISVDGGITLR